MANIISLDNPYPVLSESDNLYRRSVGLIPAHTQTLAKGPTQYVNGIAPKYLKRGKGSHVWDVDGNEFIDFSMGVGPISLGYGYKRIDEAIRRQLEDGITYSLVHPLEVECAELVRNVVPNAESIRYSKTGADVTSAAVRVARAFTGRDNILCCGYHGWHDWYIGTTGRNRGVPGAIKDMVKAFAYNDLSSAEAAIDDSTACVILEPMIFEFPKNDFLHTVRELCTKKGAVLIFDEMWTGFRFALGGAQELFGVSADLACFSKALANGMPISVLAGSSEIMQLLDEEVFFFTTFGGEALSLAAAIATITELKEKRVPDYLAKQGKKIQQGYNELAMAHDLGEITSCNGHPSRSIVIFQSSQWDPLVLKSLVQQELIKRGILWSGFHNLSYSHSNQDTAYLLQAYDEVLRILKKAIMANNVTSMLKGEPVQPVFRKT